LRQNLISFGETRKEGIALEITRIKIKLEPSFQRFLGNCQRFLGTPMTMFM